MSLVNRIDLKLLDGMDEINFPSDKINLWQIRRMQSDGCVSQDSLNKVLGLTNAEQLLRTLVEEKQSGKQTYEGNRIDVMIKGVKEELVEYYREFDLVGNKTHAKQVVAELVEEITSKQIGR